MKITDIRIREVHRSEGNLRAVASVTFDDCFVVHDIKIFERDDRRYIAMPSRRTIEGEFKDVAHPLNTETREWMQALILDEYGKLKAETE